MQAVILAAGASTRMHPLTLTRPKPLLPVLNKPILDWTLEALVGLADEIVLVVGYKQEMIKQHLANHPLAKKFTITFAEQKKQLGTANALLAAKPFVSGRFFVLNGDDVYARADLQRLRKHEYGMLVSKVEHPERFGVIQEAQNRVLRIVEKSAKPPSDLANTGAFVVDDSIFGLPIKKTKRNEYELTDLVTEFAKRTQVEYETVRDFWIPVGYPWNLLEANEFFSSRLKRSIRGTVEKGATMKGEIVVGEGTKILAGSYIDGPVAIGKNCMIGPNCYLRKGTVLGDNVHIGASVEVKNSILFSGIKAAHLTYIGDSIIGENVNVGGGSLFANLRHDEGSVKTVVKGKLVDTGRRKFGAVIGDGAHLGAGTILYPGRKVWPGKQTVPGAIVKKDIG